MKIVQLGSGEYKIGSGHFLGVPAILIQKANATGAVGEPAGEIGAAELTDDSIVICVHSLRAAMVVEDAVRELMEGMLQSTTQEEVRQ